MKLAIKPHPDFELIAGNAPVCACNSCGFEKKAKYCGVVAKWDGDSDFSVMACSDECRDILLRNPNVLLYLLKNVLNKLGQDFDVKKFIAENAVVK